MYRLFFLMGLFVGMVLSWGNGLVSAEQPSKNSIVSRAPVSSSSHTSDNNKELNSELPSKLLVYLYNRPAVQYTGFFVAIEHGYYKMEGIKDIEFKPLDIDEPFGKKLETNEAQFAIFWMPEGMKQWTLGYKTVAICRVSQKSSCGFVVNKRINPNVTKLDQIQHGRFAVWQNVQTLPELYLADKGIQSRTIPIRSNSGYVFKQGLVDALFYCQYNTRILLDHTIVRNEVQYFPLADEGFDLPEDTIFVSRHFLNAHLDLCRAFVRASWQGWNEVQKNPEESVKILYQYCQREGVFTDPYVLGKQLNIWLKHMQLAETPEQNGKLTRESYQKMFDLFTKTGKAGRGLPSYEDFYHNVIQQ